MSILENIHGHRDLAGLTEEQRAALCQEIREFLITHVSQTGGHVSSNLGVVELTVAIETVFDTAKDRLVFDVGHQSYVHKLLTDRQAAFDSLRQFGGMAGFPKPSESVADAFVAGHASSSVSIALGMARARKLTGQDYEVVTLLGDGAATGGMVYEGMNDAAVSGEPMVVILNDNTLSIDRNVGGMATHLRKIRTKERYIGMKKRYRKFMNRLPGGNAVYRYTHKIKDKIRRILIPTTIFENMGFTYLGPVDGHDTENLIYLLRVSREMRRPVVLHVITQKGKGYSPAEEHPKLFHGIGKFDPETGEPLSIGTKTFSDAFGEAMIRLAEKDSRICAITAAMPGGTGLLEFKKQFPKRLYDVGIAEEHAVSMAGGLAKQGAVPVVAVYSTFLQRAYDMILQDICLLKLHVILAVDRAGLVGEDGETHHGVFDVGFLRQAPGMTVLCPGSQAELQDMLQWAAEEQDGPVAIRYPRGGDREGTLPRWENSLDVKTRGAVVSHAEGKDAVIITYGTLLQNAMEAARLLSERGIHVSVLRLQTISPLPVEKILEMTKDTTLAVVLEETGEESCVCKDLAYVLHNHRPDLRIHGINLGKGFAPHGSVSQLYRQYGLDGESVAAWIEEVHHHEK